MDLSKAQVAVLVEHQYQELELWYPILRLREAGANVIVVGADTEVSYSSKLGYPARPDVTIADVTANDFDAVIIPGGFAPEGIRRHPAMINLVRAMNADGRLVAAICHAGWVLASAGVAKGRKLTCVFLIKDDVIHAGGNYVNEDLVIDGNLITAQLPSDLPMFGKAIVDYLADPARAPRSARAIRPVKDRAPSLVTYQEAVKLVMAPRGKSSANYTTMVIAPTASA